MSNRARRNGCGRGCALFVGLVLLGACFAVYFLTQVPTVQRSVLYPYDYREIVETRSEAMGLDPYLTAAVIMAESKFQDDVHSHKGAVGLMQLMPETAEWIAGELGDGAYSEAALHEPARNIRYGTWYLSSLLEEFHGNAVLALAAYNAGRGNVHEWMEERGWGYDFRDVSEIPFWETRAYVERVLKYRDKYKELYP